MKNKHWTWLCGLWLAMAACENQGTVYTDARAFMSAYTSEEVTRKKQCISEHCFELKLHSPSYIVAREWDRGSLADTAAAVQRGTDLEGQLFFVLGIERTGTSELAPHWSRLTRSDVYIEQRGKRIPCSFLYDETVPGLHPGRSLHLVFDAQDQLTGSDFALVLDQPDFGIARFKYNLQTINALPQFNLKPNRS